MTTLAKHTPVVVGVGDIKNRSTRLDDAVEPLDLMVQAICAALEDTGLSTSDAQSLREKVDSISVVANWTWPYPNTPEVLRSKLHCRATHLHESEHGGHSPAELLDEAARRIAHGQSTVAIVTGGEALASLGAFHAAKKFPPPGWTHLEDHTSIWEKERKHNLAASYGLGLPTQVYAMYEAALRAHRGQSPAENHRESSDLYAEYARVAAGNPIAWTHGKEPDTADTIARVTKRNRMICLPYPLVMNAFNTVNMSAACILTSLEHAQELGIPHSRLIFPLGGAGTHDREDFYERSCFFHSQSLSSCLDATLAASNVKAAEIDLFDFYSCFPIVPKLASLHLGIPIHGGKRPTTLLGGLTSFGGAGNNYSLHAITEMVRQLRSGQDGQVGLVLANGGVLSHHHAVCLSRNPRQDGILYPIRNPLPIHVSGAWPQIIERAQGNARIETYTVQYERDGSPLAGFILGRLEEGGARFIAITTDGASLKVLGTNREQVGTPVWVEFDEDAGRNTFKVLGARL
ncbi:hypothetical protein N7539_005693 [Penicillium diatomitis]|uniref:Thiolase-like protein type 1 additional C-terminal domain-containing protein n=1 Tax=Penicillium diatomitis TaxID=2819901 RepID=A0A9W9X4P9_9EURO|nr:uncharacterized protein N7539_005693 [Penicillium diatomitis]KAJ5483897.1 hypothetical protein N7539_005693 [Penicillium diatomitis]